MILEYDPHLEVVCLISARSGPLVDPKILLEMAKKISSLLKQMYLTNKAKYFKNGFGHKKAGGLKMPVAQR